LSAARKQVEKHIFNSVMRQMQMPIGVTPILVCWMCVG